RWLESSPRALVLRPIGDRTPFELLPDLGEDRFGPRPLGLARKAFAYRRDGATHAIHPRLLELVYRAVHHFEAPYVHLVSGYRTTRATSRHAQGRAIDMVLPGVSDRRLAAYLRGFGFVGVGLYPVSGFVHLDVRARSYFWEDRSGPGQRNRERAVRGGEARSADARARERGEEGIEDLLPETGEGEGNGEEPPTPEGALEASEATR
ncbi:MAG: DUF882 domain-containing protein, partial [Myxococcales bacterium]|nr:DUF882 domain-containing protein [Myxococcales bacterium]